MGIHKVKGLWPMVIGSVRETSFGVSRVETNLNQIQDKEWYSVLQEREKRAHKM